MFHVFVYFKLFSARLPVSFFLLLLKWCKLPEKYKTSEDARGEVFDYLEMFYHPKRKHAKNGLLSPVDFDVQHNTKCEEA